MLRTSSFSVALRELLGKVVLMWKVVVTPSNVFISGCLAFLAGVFISTSNYQVSELVLWSLLGVAVILVFGGLPRRAVFGSFKYAPVALGIILLSFALGAFRVNQTLDSLESQTVLSLSGESTTLIGEVISHPDKGLDGAKFILNVRDGARGKVLVTVGRHIEIKRGSLVEVSGKIRTPEPFDDFNYPMFLAKDGITTTLRANKINVVSDSSGGLASIARRGLGEVRNTIDETALDVLPYKEGAILKAVLIGDEGSMTDDFKESLNSSGLRHIVAVSGMNIAIILSLVSAAAVSLGASRKKVFWIGLLAVAFFVLLIGAPASAVRAGLMGLTIVAAPLLGRRGSGVRIAIAVAAVMVLMSPLTLKYDVGFQLSFLAVLGIITLSPLTGRPFRKLPKVLSETLSMTFAAQLAVLPLLVVVFDKVSLIAPLSNLIVVPAIALVTVWGFAAVVAGAIWLPIGQIIALPMLPYFSLVAWVAETFGRFPLAEFSSSGALAILFGSIWYGVMFFASHKASKEVIRPIDLVPLYEGIHAA